jgi:hypothetical protein
MGRRRRTALAAATDTIDYVVTYPGGLSATSTRAVFIERSAPGHFEGSLLPMTVPGSNFQFTEPVSQRMSANVGRGSGAFGRRQHPDRRDGKVAKLTPCNAPVDAGDGASGIEVAAVLEVVGLVEREGRIKVRDGAGKIA